MNKSFFIDKDGTLVNNSGYPKIIPSDVLLENDVLKGLKHIQEKGYKIIIISNQPWIAKGRATLKEIDEIFVRLKNKLAQKGIKIDDYYYCPHQSSDYCECKKPLPKMILDAAQYHKIDLSQSYTVGDMDDDILAGLAAGTKTILVKTGRGGDFVSVLYDKVDKILNNLNEIYLVI